MSTAIKSRSSSLRTRLLLAISPFLVAVAALVALSIGTTRSLSALRACVQAESLWSSAQKEAARHLEAYAASGDTSRFDAFMTQMRVPLGDRQARESLEQDDADLPAARLGLLAGGNDADDVAGMIAFFQRHRDSALLQTALRDWHSADQQIDAMLLAAQRMQHAFAMPPGAARDAQLDAALAQVHAANARLTPLETGFSAALGAASRRIRDTLQYGIIALAALLVALKLAVSAWMLRQHVAIEQALRTSENRLDMAARGSNDGIWNWMPQSRELFLSPRAITLLGLLHVPHDPLRLMRVVHGDDRVAVRRALRATSTGTGLDVEFRARGTDGLLRWLHLRGSPVPELDGGTACVAGSISDIGQRKDIERLISESAQGERRRSELAQIALLEQVQARIGRELHDDLGQRLTGIAFLAKALEQRLAQALPEEADQGAWITRLSNQAIDRVRFLSRQLSPIEIDAVSLSTALQRLVRDIRDIFGTRIALQLRHDEPQLSAHQANHLFRIAQESISNALRHGQATQIGVYLDGDGQRTRLAISDNGIGFSSAQSSESERGLGLHSMRVRMRSLGGRLAIRSGRHGTLVIARCATHAQATVAHLDVAIATLSGADARRLAAADATVRSGRR